jgi:hypothetical protein
MKSHHTTRGISAAIASSIPAAATGGLPYHISTSPFVSREFGGIRDEDSGSCCASLLYSFFNICEYREAEMLLTGFLGICSANDSRTYIPIRFGFETLEILVIVYRNQWLAAHGIWPLY